MTSSDELRRIADLIDDFPKYIRRDLGTKSVRDSICEILVRHNAALDPSLVDDLDDFTRKLRDTTHAYYRNQFL
jgi:hypothetical protein